MITSNNKFFRLLQNYETLLEGKLDDAKARNPDLADKLDKFSVEDPSGNNKYLEWAIKQLKNGEELVDIVNAVNKFHSVYTRLQSKDINSYKTTQDVLDAVYKLPEKSKTQAIKTIKSNAPKIYEDEDYFVINPKTSEAAIAYGADSRWCISAKESFNYFDDYSSKNIHFYFIIKKAKIDKRHKYNKVAIAFYKEPTTGETTGMEIYDADDDQINQNELEGVLGRKYHAIMNAIKNHLGASKFTLKYQSLLDSANEVIDRYKNEEINIIDFREELYKKTELREGQAREILYNTFLNLPIERFTLEFKQLATIMPNILTEMYNVHAWKNAPPERLGVAIDIMTEIITSKHNAGQIGINNVSGRETPGSRLVGDFCFLVAGALNIPEKQFTEFYNLIISIFKDRLTSSAAVTNLFKSSSFSPTLINNIINDNNVDAQVLKNLTKLPNITSEQLTKLYSRFSEVENDIGQICVISKFILQHSNSSDNLRKSCILTLLDNYKEWARDDEYIYELYSFYSMKGELKDWFYKLIFRMDPNNVREIMWDSRFDEEFITKIFNLPRKEYHNLIKATIEDNNNCKIIANSPKLTNFVLTDVLSSKFIWMLTSEYTLGAESFITNLECALEITKRIVDDIKTFKIHAGSLTIFWDENISKDNKEKLLDLDETELGGYITRILGRDLPPRPYESKKSKLFNLINEFVRYIRE